MTPEELERIDADVATKVMGWVVHHRNTAHWAVAGYDLDYKVKGFTSGHDRWSPSQNIAQAWEVVLHLRTKPTDFIDFHAALMDAKPEPWRTIGGWLLGEADFPLAICLAALKVPPAQRAKEGVT